MKLYRLDLLTLLISLFILNSCKNKDTIGLDVDPTKQLHSSLIDTATIVVNNMAEDTVVTSGLTKTPLGYFNDPILGQTESNIAVALNLPGGFGFTLPSGTSVIDSAVLALKYTNGFYGDSLTTKYKVNVYQLKSRILGRSYYNDESWGDYSTATLIGTRTIFVRPQTPIKIYDIIRGKPDTLKKTSPQLRIPISISFINNILFNAPSSQLNSNTVFLNTVKGLYISIDKVGTTGPGGVIMLNMADSLNVYYHTNNGTSIDTNLTALPLSTHVAQITHTPSAVLQTAFDATKNNPKSSANLIYLKGLAGTKARISFPYLKNIIANLRAATNNPNASIVINRAELVVTPASGTTIPYAPQPKLTMYRYDIAHQPIELQDAAPGDPRSLGLNAFGGFYNTTSNNYHFLVTAYIQDLMYGKTVDYGTFIAPVDNTNPTAVDIFPTVQTAGRTIAVGSDGSANRIKLNIIYTIVNNK